MAKAKSGKARSGGGATSNKRREVPIRPGSRTLDAINPAQPDYLGQATAFGKGPFVERTPKDFVALGNSLTNNVGAGGPGKGRTIYPCGYQAQTGKAAPGEGGIEGRADRGSRAILGEKGKPQP
jgi:hypothetical protein